MKKFWNGLLCRNKSSPFPVLSVAGYCKSSNSKAFANKLSQKLANNIDIGGTGIGLRIYERYHRTIKVKSIKNNDDNNNRNNNISNNDNNPNYKDNNDK